MSETPVILTAIPSKSAAHRLLIAAALADAPTRLVLPTAHLSQDIDATLRCLQAAGATAQKAADSLIVAPATATPSAQVTCDCGESGSTLRFLMPVLAALLPHGARFEGHGRLPTRPHGVLCQLLRGHGCAVDADTLPLTVAGRLTGGAFRLPGDISSQYITGLLMALPLTRDGGSIVLTTPLQSIDYVNMTLQVLSRFGIAADETADGWRVAGGQRYHSPREVVVEGDWSNAAVLLAAGAVGPRPVRVTGLDLTSRQGDRRIAELLSRFGAKVAQDGDAVTVSPAPLHGIDVDMADIPDLLPVLAAVAAFADGTTRLFNAARVRLKECDRVAAMASMLKQLGGKVMEQPDGLEVVGGAALRGGAVSVCNDHRLVMAGSLLSLGAQAPVAMDAPQAVAKSYPDFFTDWKRITE